MNKVNKTKLLIDIRNLKKTVKLCSKSKQKCKI